jgi:uncharacterized membrane protein (UPF0182 family)
MSDDLTVSEAADAIGTSPQTIRTMLRNGELRGRKEAWGKRFVWVASRSGVDDFLSQYGRLDGGRRPRTGLETAVIDEPVDVREPGEIDELVEVPESVAAVEEPVEVPESVEAIDEPSDPSEPFGELLPFEPSSPTPINRHVLLRPRVRAIVFILLVGVPLVPVLIAARILPDALWFGELGQLDVFRTILAARFTLYVLVVGGSAAFLMLNLALAARSAGFGSSRAVRVAIPVGSIMAGTFFAAWASHHWFAFLLWRHAQPFGVTDPLFGRDLGFFVFSLPFLRALSDLLLGVVLLASGLVVIVYRAGGGLTFRPLRANLASWTHLSGLAAATLLAISWRFVLDRYGLVLAQPGPDQTQPFAGAHYVDVHVRSPGLVVMACLAALMALGCVFAPTPSDRTSRRTAALIVGVPLAALIVAGLSVNSWIPALVQRYRVDPNPIVSEGPFLQRSIAGTRSGFGLDSIDVESYSPSGQVSPTDVAEAQERAADVLVWDPEVVHARMLDLVSQTPYYRPEEPTLDSLPIDGEPQPTLASARELDVNRVNAEGESWVNDHLVYTHGVGLVRFSGTGIDESQQPKLLEDGLGLREPRIYFGDFPEESPPWVVADTRLPEVDAPSSSGEDASGYHYGGSGGIQLSSWLRRAVFAMKLGNKDLLLSDDISAESRILLHRDVHDRLQTLAPFIQWDQRAASLAVGGRIVQVVAGYTTSENYPYAERVELGGVPVNYARSSVLATVDAFSGSVKLYVTDGSDPLIMAWQEVFPSLFLSGNDLPDWLKDRLRYPADLFDAQAAVYEQFHVSQPDIFASEADAWSRPTSLSGTIEVAGDINFDEDDEDDLRHRIEPGYKFAPPPGYSSPRLVISTYFSPRNGQNLVAALDGWVDEQGEQHLVSRVLPRDSITLGPAQVSRLVFAKPRVRNLLGLRNLELRDLDKSSIDTVSLGDPHILFLPGGVMQIQSLYEGASGQGVSRILGVTAYLNGHAALGDDVDSAVRQALNKPPGIEILRPDGPSFVGTPTEFTIRVRNADQETIWIRSPAGREMVTLSLGEGPGTFEWLPTVPGQAHVHAIVEGIDGSIAIDNVSLNVLSPPPTARLTDEPLRARVGEFVRVPFEVTNSRTETVTVSTRAGVIEQEYLIREGKGFIRWKPQVAGLAVIRLTARGRQGQLAKDILDLIVLPRRHVGGVPSSVSVPIDDAVEALARAEAGVSQHQPAEVIAALGDLHDAIASAHGAATTQIGSPSTAAKRLARSGPTSVFAVLDLEHMVVIRVPPMLDGMTNEAVTQSLRQILWVTQGRRDQMLDLVIALDQAGAAGGYAEGMAATLPAFTYELAVVRNGLHSYTLTPSGRATLAGTLERVRETKARVYLAFGG